MKKQLLSALLVLCMIFALLPAGAMAVDSTTASTKGVTDVSGMERVFINDFLPYIHEVGRQASLYLNSHIASPNENISSPPESQNVKGMGGIRVAEINGKGYSSLQSAVNAVQEGQTIKLMVAGYTLSAAVAITPDNETNFTFDLNGYTLGSTQGVISHKGSGTLTIIDSMHSKSAKLTTSAQNSNTIEVLNDGVLVLESGTIEHAGNGTSFVVAIHGSGYGGIYVTGGTVRTASGYAIISSFFTPINITGGVVEAQNGTAIFVAGMGGVIVGNTAKITSANADTGLGTIVMDHYDPSQTGVYLEITGGTVENTANNGNALTNKGYGTAEISGGVIDGSGVNGTGVLVYNKSPRKTIIIKKGTPVIKGRGCAINGIPLLREDVQISAGLKYESDSLADSSLSLLFPDNLHRVRPFSNYKYLRFGPTTAVAKIDTKFYADLQEAFNEGASGSTINLVADTSLVQTVFNEKGRSFTLDLNGKTLSCRSGSVLFNAWGELTITDNSADKNGCIDGDIKNGVNKLTIAGGTVRVSGSNATAIYSTARSGPIVVTGGTVSASGTGAEAIQNDSGYPVRISGNAVISSESGWAISGRQGIVIEGGWPIIKGGGMALNTGTAPNFDSSNVTVKASKFYEGTPTTAYDSSQFHSYKYLQFVSDALSPEVYNAPNKDDATIWLSGGGFMRDDSLNTKVLTSGDDYAAMMKLKEKNDVLETTDVVAVYQISLKSGMKITGNAINMHFNMSVDLANQSFTLVYNKADGTYEYFYATADESGHVTFGPFFELSPVMLVKGMLPNEPINVDEMNTQAGGVFEMYLWGINAWWFIGIGTALVFGAAVTAVIILCKRKKENR